MIRLLGPALAGLVVLVLWVYALLDVTRTDAALVRNLPKAVWVLLVLAVPLVGSLGWLIAGRPLYAGWSPGGPVRPRPTRRFIPPEDRPDWGAGPGA